MKEKDEIAFLKIKEFENKLYQEKIKLEQKTKDYSKLQEKMNEVKGDLLSQIQINQKNKASIKTLEE